MRVTGLPTPRERDYVDALGTLFAHADKLNHRTRTLALEKALEALAAKYPDDREATALDVHVLSANFDPTDKRYQEPAARGVNPCAGVLGAAEVHNNPAYVLRMQGRHSFEASLAYYDRAIVLQPTLAQAFAYRGVLFMQQGDAVHAGQDLERLRALDARLAADLKRVIEGDGFADTDRGGIAGQYDHRTKPRPLRCPRAEVQVERFGSAPRASGRGSVADGVDAAARTCGTTSHVPAASTARALRAC